MANLPDARVSIDDEAGGFAGGSGYAVVLSCVRTNADCKPRVFSSTKAVLDQHDYSQGASYVGSHIEGTRKPVLFVGLPIATEGTVRRQDSSAVTGTSRPSAAAASSGIMEEVNGLFTITKGGTIGTDSIVGTLSCDDGRSKKVVRLGTATSYTIPFLGITLTFSAGTVVAGDVFEFDTTAPLWDADGLALAKDNLAAQQKRGRTFVVVGDLTDSTLAGNVVEEVNAYETENARFVLARASVVDRHPNYLPKMSRNRKAMVGSPTLTFAEVGATGDTITRSAGSWIDDGFAVGDLIAVTGSVSNNITNAPIAALDATTITLDTTDLAAEGPVSGCKVVGSPGLTFAEVGATGDTITRSSGSFLDEGFDVGDVVAVTGTASNNVSGPVTAVTDTVLTFDSTDLVDEVIESRLVTITKVETKTAYIAAMDTAFEQIADEKRIDLSIGRGRKQCPITNWQFRRPAAWAAAIREYQHDIHITTWRKDQGPLSGWDTTDGDGSIVELDQVIDGGMLEARFTCFRSWPNGPNGTFLAMSLTRANEASLLSMSHNMHVANEFCAIVQAETEMFIGRTPVLDDDGHATEDELVKFEQSVNSTLQRELLADKLGEGQRASIATWSANRDDVLNVPDATVNGGGDLELNGTIVHVNTRTRVRTG